LHNDGMVAADNDTAARQITDNDFARLPPPVKKR
jgi:hypothetical protein